MKELGYIVGKHVNLYGEHFKLISEPFEDGGCVAVHAVSGNNPTVRTFDLPVTLLSGWEDLFLKPVDHSASELPAKTPPPGATKKSRSKPKK
jgi:hypothetical protein